MAYSVILNCNAQIAQLRQIYSSVDPLFNLSLPLLSVPRSLLVVESLAFVAPVLISTRKGTVDSCIYIFAFSPTQTLPLWNGRLSCLADSRFDNTGFLDP